MRKSEFVNEVNSGLAQPGFLRGLRQPSLTHIHTLAITMKTLACTSNLLTSSINAQQLEGTTGFRRPFRIISCDGIAAVQDEILTAKVASESKLRLSSTQSKAIA